MKLTLLPIEIQEDILFYIDWSEHGQCMKVCNLWRRILDNLNFRKLRYKAFQSTDAQLDGMLATHRLIADGVIRGEVTSEGTMLFYKAEGYSVFQFKDRNDEIELQSLYEIENPLFDEPVFRISKFAALDSSGYMLPRETGDGQATELSCTLTHVSRYYKVSVTWKEIVIHTNGKTKAEADMAAEHVTVRQFLKWLTAVLWNLTGKGYSDAKQPQFTLSHDIASDWSIRVRLSF